MSCQIYCGRARRVCWPEGRYTMFLDWAIDRAMSSAASFLLGRDGDRKETELASRISKLRPRKKKRKIVKTFM